MNKTKLFRICLILIIVIFSSPRLQAIDWGLKFGFNSTNFAMSAKTLQRNHNPHSDYILGAFLTFHLSEILAIQPEAYLSEEGAEYDLLVGSTDFYNYKYRMPYFQIPVLLKFKIPVESSFSPSLFIGPYAFFRHDATFFRVVDHGSEEDFGQKEDIKDIIKGFDYGLVFGAELDVKTCFGKIIVDMRYNIGLTNMTTDISVISDLIAEDAIFKNEKLAKDYLGIDFLKSRSFVLMVGLGF